MAIDLDSLVLGPCMDAFGTSYRFTPALGAPFDVVGVFTEAYTHVQQNGDGLLITSTDPMLGCRAAAFPPSAPPQRDDMFTINGQDWRVVDVLPDSAGHLLIQLMRAP